MGLSFTCIELLVSERITRRLAGGCLLGAPGVNILKIHSFDNKISLLYNKNSSSKPSKMGEK